MGRRHQVYLRFASSFGFRACTVGIHLQWLYGSLALRKLDQFLNFVSKTAHDVINAWNSDLKYGNPGQYKAGVALAALYSIDLETGRVECAHVLDTEDVWDGACLADPRQGDNNDGITIIDLREACKPKFAFYFFHKGDPDVPEEEQHTPLTARQYLELYHKGDPAPEGSWQLADNLDAAYELLSKEDIESFFPDMKVL